MMRFVILVAVVCGPVIGVGAAQADTCTFDVPSGDWDVLENWDCVAGGEQVPTAADRAAIQSGKICNIDSPAVADSLENRYVARRLKLTDEQKEKLAKINKDARAKRSKLFSGLRDASDEQRREAFEKYRKLRTKTGEQALALLTAEQKKAFEDMQGEKIELPSRRRRS